MSYEYEYIYGKGKYEAQLFITEFKKEMTEDDFKQDACTIYTILKNTLPSGTWNKLLDLILSTTGKKEGENNDSDENFYRL